MENSDRILLSSSSLCLSSLIFALSQHRRLTKTVSSSPKGATTYDASTFVKKGKADYWLATKAMGIGSLLAVAMVGIGVGVVCKAMRVETVPYVHLFIARYLHLYVCVCVCSLRSLGKKCEQCLVELSKTQTRPKRSCRPSSTHGLSVMQKPNKHQRLFNYGAR